MFNSGDYFGGPNGEDFWSSPEMQAFIASLQQDSAEHFLGRGVPGPRNPQYVGTGAYDTGPPSSGPGFGPPEGSVKGEVVQASENPFWQNQGPASIAEINANGYNFPAGGPTALPGRFVGPPTPVQNPTDYSMLMPGSREASEYRRNAGLDTSYSQRGARGFDQGKANQLANILRGGSGAPPQGAPPQGAPLGGQNQGPASVAQLNANGYNFPAGGPPSRGGMMTGPMPAPTASAFMASTGGPANG